MNPEIKYSGLTEQTNLNVISLNPENLKVGEVVYHKLFTTKKVIIITIDNDLVHATIICEQDGKRLPLRVFLLELTRNSPYNKNPGDIFFGSID